MRDSFSVFSRSPLSDSLYKEPFLTVNHAGVFWHKCETEGALLNSLEDLIKFFPKEQIRRSIHWKMKAAGAVL